MLLHRRPARGQLPLLAAALATLAISLGATVALFTLVDRFVVASLPFPGADRLAMVWRTHGDEARLPLAPGEFTDLEREGRNLQLAGLVSEPVSVAGAEETRRVHAMFVLGDLFELLGVEAALGRTFGPADAVAGAPRVVVISDRYWQGQLGGDPAAIGRRLEIGGAAFEVVGVLPASFRLTESLVATDPRFSRAADLWVPLDLGANASRRGFRSILALARLRQGVELAAAEDELRAYADHVAERYPDTDGEYGLELVALDEQVFGPMRPALLALWAATGFVLLLAAANLATLFLVQGLATHREVAIRLALGARRSRVFGAQLARSLLLSLLGGLSSLAVAGLAVRLLVAFAPLTVVQAFPPALGLRAIVFSLALALVAGLGFGALPAWWACRIEVSPALRESSPTFSRPSRRCLVVLVSGQIALSTALAIATGTAASSFARLLRPDLGVDLEKVATFDLRLPFSPYGDPERRIALLAELLEKLAQLPGVDAVGLNYALPLGGVDPSNWFEIEGRELESDEIQSADLAIVDPGYFAALRIPVLRGRAFTDSDTGEAPRVAIVDERMVAQHFGVGDPLGQRLRIGGSELATVVGVVGAVRLDLFEPRPRPAVYLPYPQRPQMFTSLAIRTTLADPLSLASQVRATLRELDRELPVPELSTLERAHHDAIAPQRFSLVLLALFAGVALSLTVAGVVGVMGFLAGERRREAGIRLALGATPPQIARLLVRQGLSLGLAGVAAGLAIAWAGNRVVASLVDGSGGFQPLVSAGGAALVLLATVAACVVPARRFARVEPGAILRTNG